MNRILADLRIPVLLMALLAALVLALPSVGLAQEKVGLRGGRHADFGRLVFDWPSPVGYQAKVQGQSLVVTFDRPARFATAKALARLRGYLGEAEAGSDGRSLRIALTGDYEIKHFALTNRVVIDLLGAPRTAKPAKAAETTAAAAQPSKTLQATVDRVATAQAAAKPSETARADPQAAPSRGEGAKAGPAKTADGAAPMSILPPALDQVRRKPKTTNPGGGAAPKAAAPKAPAPAPARADSSGAKAGTTQTAKTPGGSPEPATRPTAVVPGKRPSSAAQSSQDVQATGSPSAAADGGGRLEVLPAPLWLAGQEAAPGTRQAQHPLTLRFTWTEPTRAAAFRYGGDIWLVFDRPLAAGALDRLTQDDLGLGHVRQMDNAEATVIRLGTSPDQVPRLTAELTGGWLVDIRRRSPLPERSLEADLAADGDQAVLRFAVSGGGRIQWITDPDTNERLAVVPVAEQGVGVARAHRYPQFVALPSQQGVALLPISDSLEVAAARSGVLIRDRNGLLVSNAKIRAARPGDPNAVLTGHRLFDLPAWRQQDDETFLERKHALMQQTIKSSSDAPELAHLDLARFHFSWGLATETLGLLEVVASEAPRFAEDPQSLLMTGVSAFILHDYDRAAEILSHPALASEWEALLWQAALAAVAQDWQAAASAFELSDGLIGAYPPRVANRLQLLAAEARLGIGDSGGASEYLISLTRGELSSNEEASTKYLLGRRFFLDEDFDLAAKIWREIKDHGYGAARVRARLGLLELALAEGRMDRHEVTKELEHLRYSWRGDQFELTILLRLGELYHEDRQYEEALRTYRFAASHYPDSARSAGVTGQMRDIFTKVFLDEEATPVAPLKALAIYEHFKELTPAGRDGERVIERLADRLVEVDLLEKAANLLDDQVAYRLEGEERARVGARLAVVRLLDQQAPRALQALDDTRVQSIPQGLADQRRHLRARALAAMGRREKALALLNNDTSVEAVELRAEIQWEAGDWSSVASSLRQLVPKDPPDGPLGERQARIVLNLAIALTLADDRVKLIDLNKRYGGPMSGTPKGEIFALLANDIDSSGFRTIAEGLGQLNEAQAFMAGYREMVKSGRLSALN